MNCFYDKPKSKNYILLSGYGSGSYGAIDCQLLPMLFPHTYGQGYSYAMGKSYNDHGQQRYSYTTEHARSQILIPWVYN